jgi:hypothetical protein
MTNARAKGSVFHTTMDFVRAEKGQPTLDNVLGRLSPEDRKQVESATPLQEVPFEKVLSLWKAVDAEIGKDDPGWIERSGAHSIKSMGVQMYSGILRKSSPKEFLTQRVSLFKLYYHPGDMEVVEESQGHAVLRLVGFDYAGPLFCRRQTGGLSRALEVAGGQRADTAHVRCVAEGDAFCEWEVRWE